MSRGTGPLERGVAWVLIEKEVNSGRVRRYDKSLISRRSSKSTFGSSTVISIV